MNLYRIVIVCLALFEGFFVFLGCGLLAGALFTLYWLLVAAIVDFLEDRKE